MLWIVCLVSARVQCNYCVCVFVIYRLSVINSSVCVLGACFNVGGFMHVMYSMCVLNVLK